MSRFFWRIFLAVWTVAVLSVALTLFVAAWLPANVDEDARDAVEGVAAETGELLAADPEAGLGAAVLHRQALAGGGLRIFLVDAEGRDALGRRLPLPVARWLRRGNPALMDDLDWASNDPRLTVHGEAVGGYRVVGYRAGFRRPVERALDRRGGRLVALGAALAASAAASFVLARLVALPVRRLRRASRRAAGGDLGVRIAPAAGNRADELAGLAGDFDLMTERVAASADARQRMLRGVSRELRTTLARLRDAHGTGDDARADAVEGEIGLLDGLITQIDSFARLETQTGIRRARVDLAHLVRGVAGDAEGRAGGTEVRVDALARLPAEVDGYLLRRALENVLAHALRRGPPDGVVEVEVGATGDGAAIAVSDRGPEVPGESFDRLFEPFFRSGDAGDGGVGLAIARRAVELHGGSVAAASREDGGLRIEIRIPMETDEAA